MTYQWENWADILLIFEIGFVVGMVIQTFLITHVQKYKAREAEAKLNIKLESGK